MERDVSLQRKYFSLLAFGVFSVFIFFLGFLYVERSESERLRESLDYQKSENVSLRRDLDNLSFQIRSYEREIEILTAEIETLSIEISSASTSSAGDLPSSILNEINEVFAETARIRELSGSVPSNIQKMTPSEAGIYISRANRSPEIESLYFNQEVMLKFLGLIPEEMNYQEFLNELVEEQVGGFYDSARKMLVIVSEDTDKENFTSIEKFILSHELTHSLQDQNFSIVKDLSRYSDPMDMDEYAAKLAVVEGDAVLLMQEYLLTLSPAERMNIGSASAQLDSPLLRSAPNFIRRNLLFPYQEGFNFMSYFYARGSWDAVNNVIEDPPLTTSEILRPEKYLDGVIVKEVSLSEDDSSLDGENVFSSIMGEWGYLILFEEYMGGFRAKNCTVGWSGDKVSLFYNESIDLYEVVLRSEWESDIIYDCMDELKSEFENENGERYSIDMNFSGGEITIWIRSR